jgi:hypothetical protein
VPCTGSVKQFVVYPKLDRLVVNGKKIFVKLPARIEALKNNAPDHSL